MSSFKGIVGGRYNSQGIWVQEMFCMLPCNNCTCQPPNDVWDLSTVFKDEAETLRMMAEVRIDDSI